MASAGDGKNVTLSFRRNRLPVHHRHRSKPAKRRTNLRHHYLDQRHPQPAHRLPSPTWSRPILHKPCRTDTLRSSASLVTPTPRPTDSLPRPRTVCVPIYCFSSPHPTSRRPQPGQPPTANEDQGHPCRGRDYPPRRTRHRLPHHRRAGQKPRSPRRRGRSRDQSSRHATYHGAHLVQHRLAEGTHGRCTGQTPTHSEAQPQQPSQWASPPSGTIISSSGTSLPIASPP